MRVSYRKRIIFSFITAVIVLMTVAASVYSSFKQIEAQKRRVDHTYVVISTVQEILSSLKDIQSSTRGYVITGMEDYLVPYFVAVPKVNEQATELSRMIRDNPEQIKRFQSLDEHIEGRLETADKVIELYKSQGQKAAMDMVRQGSGKREMDEIRIIVAEMVAEEENLLATRRSSVENYSRITMIAGLSGLIICIAILSAVFVLIDKEAERRAKTEDSLRRAFSDMERNNSETKMIGRMGDYLRGCRVQSEAYQMIGVNMPAIFPDTFGSVVLFNNSRNLLTTVLDWGSIPSDLPREFEPESCWALRQGRVHFSPGDNSVPVCDHLVKLDDGAVTICLPMQAQGETIGQIFIGTNDPQKLGAHEMATMRTVTEQISLALANLNLQRALREQSIKDPLTKLYNRRYLEETLARECARADRNKQSLCVLIMDIDHFKKVNDVYGHDAGDAVLVAFASLLLQKSRKEDIACRLGGEEFVLVLPTATLELASQRAEEICESVRKMKVKFQNQTLNVTVSIGVSKFPEHGRMPEELIRNADLCLYKAKQNGRNQVVLFDESMESA